MCKITSCCLQDLVAFVHHQATINEKQSVTIDKQSAAIDELSMIIERQSITIEQQSATVHKQSDLICQLQKEMTVSQKYLMKHIATYELLLNKFNSNIQNHKAKFFFFVFLSCQAMMEKTKQQDVDREELETTGTVDQLNDLNGESKCLVI